MEGGKDRGKEGERDWEHETKEAGEKPVEEQMENIRAMKSLIKVASFLTALSPLSTFETTS